MESTVLDRYTGACRTGSRDPGEAGRFGGVVVGDVVGALLNPLVLAPLVVLAAALVGVFGSLPFDEAAKRLGGVWLAAVGMFLWAPKDDAECVAFRSGAPPPNVGGSPALGRGDDAISRILGTPTVPGRPELAIQPPRPDEDACGNPFGFDMLGTTGTTAYVHDLRDYPTPGMDYRLTFDLTPFVVAAVLIAGAYLLRGKRQPDT
jgi:hypothetical protein